MIKKTLKQALKNNNNHSSIVIWVKISFAIFFALLIAFIVVLLFPQLYINNYIKEQITTEFKKAYPSYSIDVAKVRYKILENNLELDSIGLIAVDSSFSAKISTMSVKNINWIQVLKNKKVTSISLSGSSLNVEKIEYVYNQYKFRCRQLKAIFPDSSIIAERIEINPLTDDDHFFEKSKFRDNRYIIVIPQFKLNGADFNRLFQKNEFSIRTARLSNVIIDVFLNRDKPRNTKSFKLKNPTDIFSKLEKIIQIDSLLIINGKLKYAERIDIKSEPGVLTINNINIIANKISDSIKKDSSIIINAEANLMKSGLLNVNMVIPISSPDLSLKYSGTLSKMDIQKLNPFLELAENARIKSGDLKKAKFNIIVKNGYSSGTVYADYDNLYIAVLNKETGSETTIKEQTTTFIGNILKINRNNMYYEKKKSNVGIVSYKRKSDESVARFIWVSLRRGIIDLVGF